VLAAGYAIVVQHQPVRSTAEGHVLAEVEINSAATEHGISVAGRSDSRKRSRSMIAADQDMHERRVCLVGAQRELRPEGVAVVANAHAALGREAGPEVSGDAEVMVEVPVEGEGKAIGIDAAFQASELIAAEELSLRIALRFRRHRESSEQPQHASQNHEFTHLSTPPEMSGIFLEQNGCETNHSPPDSATARSSERLFRMSVEFICKARASN